MSGETTSRRIASSLKKGWSLRFDCAGRGKRPDRRGALVVEGDSQLLKLLKNDGLLCFGAYWLQFNTPQANVDLSVCL